MPYSPLYQSIRIVLFGALGLSAFSVGAKTPPMLSESSNIDSIASTASNTTHLESTDTISANNGMADIAAPSVAADSHGSVTSITPIQNQDPLSITPSANVEVDSAHPDNASIDRSLARLTQYYQVTPATNIEQRGLTLDKFLGRSDETGVPNSDNPKSPIISNPFELSNANQDDLDSINSSARCEGRWVYPKSSAPLSSSSNSSSSATNAEGNTDNGNNNPAGTLYAQADYGYYDNVDYAELSGNVIIDQGSQHIEAEKIILDLTQRTASAQGQVMFTDSATTENTLPNQNNTNGSSTGLRDRAKGGLIGVADSLAYNTETGQSTAKDVAFASIPLQAHGYAKRMNRPNDSQYELDEVMFTTCPPTDRKWQIDAKNIDLDTDTGRGEAYNTTFRIKDVPVFYLPYFNFPIDSRRSSGFLVPRISVGSESGVELDIPYYFNLAPNYDVTLNTHIYTNRNPMLTGEFRYLTDNFGGGQITGSYLPRDKEYNDEDRSSLFYDHYWASKSIPRLSGDITYQYVSDADYLNDFDTLGLSENTLNLPRRARLNYYNDYINGELKVETYQSLNAFGDNGKPLQDKDKPYSRLPQLTFDYRLPWSDSIKVTGTHDSAYFKKSIDDGSEAEKSGLRIYNKLSASYPLEKPWGYVEPKFSLQHLFTSYDQDSLDDNQLNKEDGSQSVFVPQFSVDSGLNFFRSGSPFGLYDDSLGGYQMLSPRLKYTYAPFKDQNNLPNFNTRIASINYEQLYADSWFLGHDRLQDLHAITPGLNYRYIDAMGVTRLDANIAEQFYFDDGEVTLNNQSEVFKESSSGLVWETSAQPYRNFWVDLNGALTNSYDLNYVTTQLRYQPTSDSLFNVGYINRRADKNTEQLPLSALTASTIFPVNNNWRVLAQGQFDLRRDKMLDALVGIDYEDCCFGFAVYGRRYYNDLNLSDKPNQAVMAEIRLNGLSNGKSRLTRLLSDRVLGFEPVDTAWKD